MWRRAPQPSLKGRISYTETHGCGQWATEGLRQHDEVPALIRCQLPCKLRKSPIRERGNDSQVSIDRAALESQRKIEHIGLGLQFADLKRVGIFPSDFSCTGVPPRRVMAAMRRSRCALWSS